MLFFPKLPRRKILVYSPLAVLPDIDFFFGHGWLHNIFFLAFLTYCAYHLSGKNKEATFIATYFWASHLVLDLQFVALFYPIYKGFISFHADVFINPSLSQSIPAYLLGGGGAEAEAVNMLELFKYRVSANHLPETALYAEKVSPILTSFGLITVIYALFALTIYKLRDRIRLP